MHSFIARGQNWSSSRNDMRLPLDGLWQISATDGSLSHKMTLPFLLHCSPKLPNSLSEEKSQKNGTWMHDIEVDTRYAHLLS